MNTKGRIVSESHPTTMTSIAPAPRARTVSSPLLPSLPAVVRDAPNPPPMLGPKLASELRWIVARGRAQGACPLVCYALEAMADRLTQTNATALRHEVTTIIAIVASAGGLGPVAQRTKAEVLTLLDRAIQGGR